jgi:CubicO group peptidase (beta-lactamase class C family)
MQPTPCFAISDIDYRESKMILPSRYATAAVLFFASACAAGDITDVSQASAAQPRHAETAPHTPPGYTPPNLITPGYNPPNLLMLTPERQLAIYKRMEEFYIGQPIKRGASASPLPLAAKQITPIVSWQGKTYTELEAFMTAARLTGVLVLKNGEIALERYALGRTATDRWTSFSVGKSVTSLLVGAAIQDGYILSLDEPVTKYIPQLTGSAYDGVNIRQLLTMTSGVKWNEDYADPNSDVALSSIWPGEPGMNPIVSYMRRLPRASEPGTAFSYKTGETDMAGVLVANATGRGLAQYLSEKIWGPYGMDQDGHWVVDGGSLERGGCCISMSLRDYGRIGQFVLGGGVANGKQVVPAWYLKEATENQIAPPATGSYGYFWWIDAPGLFSARGIFGQSILVIPSEGLVLVTNGAFGTAVGREGSEAVSALLAATRTALR